MERELAMARHEGKEAHRRTEQEQAGLPIKNQPNKKPTQKNPPKKTHLKKPTKMGFFGFF
jgi:hypothetical protein